MANILVTGVGGPAGRNVAGLLLERGHRVVGCDMQPVQLPGIEFYQAPPARDPSLLEFVHSVALRTGVELIIPTVSEELPVFAAGWHQAIPAVIASAAAVKTADDKYLTARAFAAHGVDAPRFVLPSQLASADDLAERIGWPCISKPRVGRGGREVALHKPEDWPQIAALSDDYILQEFAGGTDYAPNLYIPAEGEALVVVLEKTELKEGLVGNAKAVQCVEAPDVAEAARRAARAVGLRGPLDIDIRRSADGVPLVLEINARFGANIRHAPEVLDAVLRAYLPA